MEVIKASNKTELKFLDVLSEFPQFWAMDEFESKANMAAFPASLHGFEQPFRQEEIISNKSQESKKKKFEPGQPRPCNCGEIHRGEDCFYLAEGKAPLGFEKDERIVKKFQKACHRIPFRTFIRKSEWTARWLKEYVDANWPTGSQQKDSSKSPQDCHSKRVTLNTSVGSTALATNLSHLLYNEILLDNGADGHVCNNLGLATSILENPTSPTFVQSGSGTSSIVGYGSMVFKANLGNGKAQEITLTDVAFAPDFLTSVVSWKMIKRKGVKWETDTNVLTLNGNLICQLLDRHNHDVFTLEPIPADVRHSHIAQLNYSKIEGFDTLPISSQSAMVNSTQPRKSTGTEYLWHQRLGHPGPEALKHIQNSSVNLEKNGPRTNECQVCALNKATKIISR
ncbi:hypothetical protein K3495_g15340 [Podosphaera aphanis]|nr:hypothetical protein K3495_g15340 [Podosphaera aphanis]